MHKRLILAILLALLLGGGGTACSNYTKTMEESVTKADETAAIGALHTLTAAQQTYSTTNNGRYGSFEQLVSAGYLDQRFNSEKPKFKGYVLTLSVSEQGGEPSYSVNADPEPPMVGRHFYFDSVSTVTHVNLSQSATATDPPINP